MQSVFLFLLLFFNKDLLTLCRCGERICIISQRYLVSVRKSHGYTSLALGRQTCAKESKVVLEM